MAVLDPIKPTILAVRIIPTSTAGSPRRSASPTTTARSA